MNGDKSFDNLQDEYNFEEQNYQNEFYEEQKNQQELI